MCYVLYYIMYYNVLCIILYHVLSILLHFSVVVVGTALVVTWKQRRVLEAKQAEMKQKTSQTSKLASKLSLLRSNTNIPSPPKHAPSQNSSHVSSSSAAHASKSVTEPVHNSGVEHTSKSSVAKEPEPGVEKITAEVKPSVAHVEE